MTTNPYVELLTGGEYLGDISPLGKPAGTLAEVIASAVINNRMMAIEEARLGLSRADDLARFLELVDIAGAVFMRRFSVLVVPAIASAYMESYRQVGAGDVPLETVYALAQNHSERLGRYFHETTREGLSQGFTTYVNRRLPARAAADRALEMYGLTPRQVSGYTSLKQPSAETVTPLDFKRRAGNYIETSIRQRAKIFGEQEEHSVSLQAKQTAWLWLQETEQMEQGAEKVWLTAKDERTCKVCAPMHGKRAKIAEKFVLPNKIEVWVPGVHPNCRCEIRLVDLTAIKGLLSKADDRWYNDEFKRTSDGRFSAARAATTRSREEVKADLERKFSAAARARATTKAEPETEISLDTPIQLGTFTPVQAISLTDSEIGLNTPAAKVETEINLGAPAINAVEPIVLTDVELALDNAIALDFTPISTQTALDVEVQTDAPTKTKTKRAVHVKGTTALGTTAYHVVEGIDYNFQFANETFSGNEVEAIKKAADLKNALMEEKFEFLTQRGDFTYPGSYPTHAPGIEGQVILHLTDRDLWQVIRAMGALETFDDDEDATSDLKNNFLQVGAYRQRQDQYRDEGQGPGFQEDYIDEVRMSVEDVARAFDISPEEFAVRVLAVQEVHNRESDGARGGDEYGVGGNYTSYAESHSSATAREGRPVYVKLIHIEPDSPETVVEWHEEG